MKISDYARKVGITKVTAYSWFHKNMIPGAKQLPTGTIYIPDNIFSEQAEDIENGLTIVYARVSSSEQRKTNLETQAKRLEDFCVLNGWKVDKVVKEVGSGLNDERPKLTKILTDEKKIKRLVVEHKDRLTRFGFNYLELFAKKQGFEIVVVNPMENNKDELMEDFVSIITSFCARLYSRRSYKRKAIEILGEVQKNETSRKTSNK